LRALYDYLPGIEEFLKRCLSVSEEGKKETFARVESSCGLPNLSIDSNDLVNFKTAGEVGLDGS
jgi:hypothetical protein